MLHARQWIQVDFKYSFEYVNEILKYPVVTIQMNAIDAVYDVVQGGSCSKFWVWE